MSKSYRLQTPMNKSTSRDGRADNAQALKACDPTGRVGSNPTPDATITLTTIVNVTTSVFERF